MNIKTFIIGIVTGFANGLFGSGGGTIVVPCMQKFMNTETKKSHATAIAIILPLSIVTGFIYLRGVEIDWSRALFVSLGGIAGGFLGAKLLGKISSKWIHIVFGVFMIIAAGRMIL